MKPCRLGEYSRLRANARKRERLKMTHMITNAGLSHADTMAMLTQFRKVLDAYSTK